MSRRKKSQKTQLLGPLEIDIMKVVWELGDVAVSDVLRRLRPQRQLHHNTVMTTMKRLTDKGLLEEYARDGRTNGYRPKVSREEICRNYMNLVVEQFFGGSVVATMAGFLSLERIPKSKRQQLKKLVEELEEEDQSG